MWIINIFKNLKYLIFGKKKVIIPTDPGLVISPEDRRDISLEWMQPKIELRELPKEYIIPYKLKILNQNNYPACVGFSSAVMKAEKERREQKAVDFDGLWIYRKCKEEDQRPDIQGTWFRIGLKILQKVGAKPWNVSETEASKFKIGSYARVNDLSFDGLKSAIFQNGVILAGFYGDREGWRTAYLKPPKKATFGHAVALTGWNKDYIIGQNSFGKNWGDQGLFYLPRNYTPMEAWAILTDLPSDFDLTPDLPKYEFKNDLYFGMRNNEEVKILQKILKIMGCFPLRIYESGNYFSITVKAVKCYQARKGISQVGRFGPLTRAAMNEELKT